MCQTKWAERKCADILWWPDLTLIIQVFFFLVRNNLVNCSNGSWRLISQVNSLGCLGFRIQSHKRKIKLSVVILTMWLWSLTDVRKFCWLCLENRCQHLVPPPYGGSGNLDLLLKLLWKFLHCDILCLSVLSLFNLITSMICVWPSVNCIWPSITKKPMQHFPCLGPHIVCSRLGGWNAWPLCWSPSLSLHPCSLTSAAAWGILFSVSSIVPFLPSKNLLWLLMWVSFLLL